MATFNKPFLEIHDQISQLKQRGMTITDDAKAASYLERLGYYRLSGYWYPMRQSAVAGGPPTVLDAFRAGVLFEHVADLYVFDKKLRMLILDAVERVEVALRVAIAIQLGRTKPYGHMDKSALDGNFAKKMDYPDGETKHDQWLSKYRRCVKRSSEDFIKHFKTTYPSQGLPVWVAIEVWDFGTTSTFLSGMAYADRVAIASRFNVPRQELLTSWARTINEVRNTCAHHSRLWNKPLINMPASPKTDEIPLLNHTVSSRQVEPRLYIAAAVLQYLLRTINPSSTWAQRLKAHLATFPTIPGVAISHSGFPNGWETLPLWQ